MVKEKNPIYGINLKKIKTELGLNTKQLADKLGISEDTLSSYERSIRIPSIELANLLLNNINININWFVSGEGTLFLRNKNTLKQINQYNINKQYAKCGHRIIKIQETNDLTNKEMAKIMGVSEGTYMKICAGNDTPNEKELNRLKENFDVDMDWLMYGDSDAQFDNINNQQNQALPPLTPEQYQKLINLLNNH